MVDAHMEYLVPAWRIALSQYPAEVVVGLFSEVCDGDARSLARRVVEGELVAVTAMPQGDGEPDDAYCLRYVLTFLAEATDS
jgi:hypothetical protein